MSFAIDPQNLRDLVIRPTLNSLELGGDAAEEIMLGTALQESGDGRRLIQAGGGPALGIWQMEPATYNDIWMNFLTARPVLMGVVRSLRIPSIVAPLDQLEGNLYYACAMARLVYYRRPEPLPAAGDLAAQAAFYVQHYNAGGKATINEYIANWRAAFPT